MRCAKPHKLGLKDTDIQTWICSHQMHPMGAHGSLLTNYVCEPRGDSWGSNRAILRSFESGDFSSREWRGSRSCKKKALLGVTIRDADLIRDGPSEFCSLRPQWAIRSLMPPGNARPAQKGRRGRRCWGRRGLVWTGVHGA